MVGMVCLPTMSEKQKKIPSIHPSIYLHLYEKGESYIRALSHASIPTNALVLLVNNNHIVFKKKEKAQSDVL